MEEKILQFLREDLPLTDVKSVLPDDTVVKDNIREAYEGNVEIDGCKVTLQIILNKDFPLSKPRFFLKQPYVLGFIPHVQQSNGCVCYVQDEGLVLDMDNPTGIIDECLKRVIINLTRGKKGDNKNDFYEEFESYWAELKNGEEWISFVKITPFLKEIVVAFSEEWRSIVLGDTLDDIAQGVKRFFGKEVDVKILKWGIYIPLRAPIRPPSPDNFWSAKDMRQLVFKNISGSNGSMLKNLLKKKKIKKNGLEFVFLSMPISKGKYALAGVKFSKFASQNGAKSKVTVFPHPLYQVGSTFQMTPHLIRRYDMDYILPRAGALLSLADDKRVLLIGCGSVGGHIAFELARAGVANLTLVDSDNLNPENIHRQLLGADRLCKLIEVDGVKTYEAHSKVEGLREEIEAKYPYITVKTFEGAVQDFIKDKILDPCAFDLIIVALGNTPVELFLNRYFHEQNNCPPAIFAWNEPLGIGGHALVTKNNGRSGCLECLYHRDPDNPLYNNASFAAPNQFFGKTVSGCSNVFTPYGSMDSIQTAVLATRLGINVLLGYEPDNPVLSWKGDDRLFLEQNYKLSSRYAKLSLEQLFESRYEYKLQCCKICGCGREL
ncbi:MAG TPA: thiamine biosynthesis protein ThiF [Candidatus Atribacteria bacterium]|nr:thiamine biosynthesis protein ThiF [Candidatus Atribacteria bacterium]